MTANEPTAPRRPRRWPFVLLLVVSLVWLGLVAGAAAGAAWLVPRDSGLAGGAMVLGYGVLGAAAGALLAGLLGWKVPHRALRTLTLVCALAALAVAGLAAWRMRDMRAEQQAELGIDLPPPAGSRIDS